MAQVDLHTHTTFSDGELSPRQLILRAAQNGVETLSITDHDSLEAYSDQLYTYAHEQGVSLIPGVEISTIDSDGTRAHILGYGIDPSDEKLLESLAEQHLARSAYTAAVCERLVESGWDINIKQLLNLTTPITKAHIARAVIDNPSNSRQIKKLFGEKPTTGLFIESFLIRGRSYYLPVVGMMTPSQATAVIHQAGGIASYAHPVANLYEAEVDLAGLEEDIIDSGVDGVEAKYLYHSKRLGDIRIDKSDIFTELAKRLGLLITGGSDFHGMSALYGNYIDVGFKNSQMIFENQILSALKLAIAARNNGANTVQLSKT